MPAVDTLGTVGRALAQKPQTVGSLVARSGAHLYFAETPEQLTPLMKFYGNRRMLLRPSNLEDVFLEIVGAEALRKGFSDDE